MIKMYQSLVRFGKEIMMVKNEYLRLFGGFKKSYPRSYERRIADYLNRFEKDSAVQQSCADKYSCML